LVLYLQKILKSSPVLTVLLFATWLYLRLAFYHQTRTSSFVRKRQPCHLHIFNHRIIENVRIKKQSI
jgi:hypothetical protein